MEAIEKAAKDFQTLSIERGEWVEEDKMGKYLKSATYRSGGFIRKEFKFTNWVKKSYHYYYSKKDLIALNEELEKRNISLSRYEQSLVDKAEFDKSLVKRKPAGKKDRAFEVPKGLCNITTLEIPKPDAE